MKQIQDQSIIDHQQLEQHQLEQQQYQQYQQELEQQLMNNDYIEGDVQKQNICESGMCMQNVMPRSTQIQQQTDPRRYQNNMIMDREQLQMQRLPLGYEEDEDEEPQGIESDLVSFHGDTIQQDGQIREIKILDQAFRKKKYTTKKDMRENY
jgi:hypothetical protein